MANNLPAGLTLESLNVQIEQLKNVEDDIRLAKQAGVPVADLETQARDTRTQLVKLKQTYFPGQ